MIKGISNESINFYFIFCSWEKTRKKISFEIIFRYRRMSFYINFFFVNFLNYSFEHHGAIFCFVYYLCIFNDMEFVFRLNIISLAIIMMYHTFTHIIECICMCVYKIHQLNTTGCSIVPF